MLSPQLPSFNLAIAPLTTVQGRCPQSYAIWVLQAPYTGGYVHQDCSWSSSLSQTWQQWQAFFSVNPLPVSPALAGVVTEVSARQPEVGPSFVTSHSSRLMQELGLQLWQWLFSGSVEASFAQSQGIAQGRELPLRLRLDIRAPELMPLPWEIAQPRIGKAALSLTPQLLFSRTTCDVDPLVLRRARRSLNMLLVLGKPEAEDGACSAKTPMLALDDEAQRLVTIFQAASTDGDQVPYGLDILVQPTAAELTQQLQRREYHIFLYAGHGATAPDGGLLFLGEETTLSGTELAQILVRSQVTLAVFNTCWGAQLDSHDDQYIARSSVAEVLLHHGVPAALAMRDAIADSEALSFIEQFAGAIAQGHAIERAVAIARQQLLTLYKFNQPAWTLPVLYLHPEFDGYLLDGPEAMPADQRPTELPEDASTALNPSQVKAYLTPQESSGSTHSGFELRGGLMRLGRSQDNEAILVEPWVSQYHAEIFVRHLPDQNPTYVLRDFSRYGTLIEEDKGWRKIHHQEMALTSGMILKFGSSQGQPWQFCLADGEF
ncbi:CHAT domain-containing protein [Geitlerinema sp. P-1104]|uniref:CHAT domain-containing protein n=1 Tax=Geitlerinema sp. P-1104 TaxID=2546230 RepID=UPI001476BAEE|nr:CHAT domain-containing protein [Geitlerinema sp. P-1104]NMG57626.1 CHAT domain-containing protein [Geitlerinema sp. P-1104]